MAAALKRFVVSNMKRSLIPLIRPAADSPLIRLKRMTPGSPHAHLALSSLPFFERDHFNRFPLTRKFSDVLLRWTDSKEALIGERWVNTPECLTIYINLSGMIPEKLNVGFRDPVDGNCLNFFICGDADLTFGYVADDLRHVMGMFTLPEKIRNYKISDVKAELGRKSGELKVTIPKLPKPSDTPVIPPGCQFDVNVSVIDDR